MQLSLLWCSSHQPLSPLPFQTPDGVDADAVTKDVEALKLDETTSTSVSTTTPAAATELPPVLKRFFDVFFLYNKFLVLEMRPWCERELQQLVAPVSELLKLGGCKKKGQIC